MKLVVALAIGAIVVVLWLIARPFVQRFVWIASLQRPLVRGLNPWALRFVDQPSVRREPTLETFGDTVNEPLAVTKYIFPDGRVFYEGVQWIMWQPRPGIFLALKDDEGVWVRDSMWSPEERKRVP